VDHFRDKSFQAVNCTGAHDQTDINQKMATRKAVVSINRQQMYAVILL